MLSSIFDSFKDGFKKIRDNHQLGYTILVAIVIFLAFIFMAERFLSIAQDAQDRLINVRVGSIQDAFVQFAPEGMEEPAELRKKIQEISASNTTIRDFRVVDIRNREPVILTALDAQLVGGTDQENTLLYNLAIVDPKNSFTIEESEDGERFFKTARAIQDPETLEVIGVVMTRQTLSEADKAIENSLRNSIGIFVVVIALVMFLFFRHAKIIDYAVLYRKLKEVDQLKDDFISMASHELRTPLTAIRGYAEFLDDSAKLNEEEQDYMNKIQSSAERLDNLVADMLDVSRIEQGRMSFDMQVTNPEHLIEDTVSELVNQAKEKGLKLVNLGGPCVDIAVDLGRLKQVLINIIGNAIKYTPKGKVEVSTHIEDEKLSIRVSDTGLGMSNEEQGELFQKFTRLGDEETKKIKGTGLGLWISRQIIGHMGGTIYVESIKGKGSDFVISLPVYKG